MPVFLYLFLQRFMKKHIFQKKSAKAAGKKCRPVKAAEY
jgi:hypothetical protein